MSGAEEWAQKHVQGLVTLGTPHRPPPEGQMDMTLLGSMLPDLWTCSNLDDLTNSTRKDFWNVNAIMLERSVVELRGL